jgi:hypothetical protein
VLAEPVGFKLTEELGTIATATDSALTQLWIGMHIFYFLFSSDFDFCCTFDHSEKK